MNSNENSRPFKLSLSQLNILNLERSLRSTSVNNICTTVHIRGRLDFVILQKTLDTVLSHDSTLRTRLIEQEGEILQFHAPHTPEEFPIYDFSSSGPDGIANWESAVTHEPIPLFGGPLYRFVLFKDSEAGGGLLVKLHHIISDGWSMILLCNRIASVYLDLLGGKEPAIEDAPDYELHVKEEQEYLASRAYGRDAAYWKKILSGAAEPTVLKNVSSAAISPVGQRLSFELPEILNHAIYTYCEEKRVAPFSVFCMALAIYFKRIGGASPFTIGVPIFNRTNYIFKQSTGMFVTTLPFLGEIDDAKSLNEFGAELADAWMELLRHQRYPFSHISELNGGERLFHIALSYQDSKIFESRDASVSISGRWHYCGYQAEQLTIHLTNLTSHRHYAVDYDYLAQFFTEDEIRELHKNLCHILSEALADPDRPIHALNVLSLEQKEEVLYTFNRTDKFLEERSVYAALREHNARHPNRAAIICRGERLTYGALFEKSDRYAAGIAAAVTEPCPLIAILLPRSFELAASMTAVLKTGGAFVLLSESLPDGRIRAVLEKSGAAALITDNRNRSRCEGLAIPVLYTDTLEESYALPSPVCTVDNPAERLAYVVYTSGSTGEPKGVEITQLGLLNFAQEMEGVYGPGAVLSICNIGFDAFMLESMAALLCGRTVVFPEEDETGRPERLAALMNGYAVDFMAITPSRLSAFLKNDVFRRVLHRMSAIVCGGEPFTPELLRKLKACTKARIYNQYGPSEATVAVSMKELSAADKITVGQPLGNCRMYVLDQWMNPLPIGGRGKLFVGGKCVGRGYRGRADLTGKVFGDSPFVWKERIYDTGDLAYWTPDGEIVLMGRADRQVKLRGLRIELSEISSCLEAYPGVHSAYAKISEIGGQPVIGGYYTAEQEFSQSELLSHLATYLPSYMIPLYLVRVDAFVLNANGKIDESALPLPEMNTEEGTGTDTARGILEIFAAVLEKDDLTITSDYFLSGGSSLNMLTCLVQIEEQYGIRLRPGDLYACRTAARLAALIDEKRGISAPARRIVKAPRRDKYPLMPIQQGIYVQSVLDPTGLAYNMPGAFRLEKAPDKARLQAAFEAMIHADPIFATSFVQTTEGVFAVIADHVTFVLEEPQAATLDEACEAFVRPFDLSAAPLLRAAVWQSKEGEWYLLLDGHHIIGDGMSTPLILERLDRFYCAKPVADTGDFYDYLAACEADPGDRDGDLAYWKDKLRELPDPLLLPTDNPKGKDFDFAGGEWEHPLPDWLCRELERFCREGEVSEFVLMASAFSLVLSALTGRADFVIGTPCAGRELPGSEKIAGPFIKTLPLRFVIDHSEKKDDWLAKVGQAVMGMLDHTAVGLEEILAALTSDRAGQNSLYRVMLTQSPVDENSFTLDGSPMHFQSIPTHTVKMDLILEIAKRGEGRVLRFSYASSLFNRDTVALWGRCVETALISLTKAVNPVIGELPILSNDDRERYLEGPNYAVTPFDGRPIHRLVKMRAASSPDSAAVIWHGEEYTLGQIERRACRIAHEIEASGIEAGSCIALCLARTPDMIAAMLGVLKAGCSYMFLVPSLPQARMLSMLTLADAAVLVHDGSLPPFTGDVPACPLMELPEGECESYADRPVGPDSLVNVLFTSGSTGQPKGVMLRHRSVSNLTSQMKSLLDPIEGRVLCSTNAIFDCFIVETLIALALGRTVVLADEEEMMLPWKLGRLIADYHAGITEMTPSRLRMCLGSEDFCRAAAGIRIVLLGGEVVTRTLADKFHSVTDGILMNMYGPTEATVFTTMGAIAPGGEITIGKPLANTRLYVLDEEKKPVLPTAVGELYIAGECLSAGYIGLDELTSQSFTDDPFFPGEKMYKSGDLVRLRTDGRFDYIGRRDQQIKMNGQRVELSEISGTLEAIDGIRQAAADAVRGLGDNQELFAFLVCDENAPGDEAILASLAGKLPAYMVPSRLYRIDKMPLTATNKIDRVKLREWAQNGILPGGDAVKAAPEPASERSVIPDDGNAPVPGSEAYVASVWTRVLGREADLSRTFFSQGGTSLAALTVLSHYYNDHFEMSLGDFYENPTAAAQSALLSARSMPEADPGPVPSAEEKKPLILITGASGFFGSHLLAALVRGGANGIHALVRGGRAHLLESMSAYFGAEGESLCADITVLDGDLTADRLGLDEAVYDDLAARTGAIYHCAADVRHYAKDDDSHRKINVEATARLLKLAHEASAAFYHMSTCSVSGDKMKDGSRGVVFTEDDLDIGQIWERNVYVRTKFRAEELVHAAMREGLKAKIFRLGRLVGRQKDGKFQNNPDSNAFYLFLKGLDRLGCCPVSGEEITLDIMPVDLAASRVLALTKADGTVFHIQNGCPPTLGEILKAAGSRAVTVPDDAFCAALTSPMTEDKRALAAMVLNQYLQMEAVRDAILVDSRITAAALASVGYCEAPICLETALKEFIKGE